MGKWRGVFCNLGSRAAAGTSVSRLQTAMDERGVGTRQGGEPSEQGLQPRKIEQHQGADVGHTR